MADLNNFVPPQYAYNVLAEQSLLKIAVHGDALALQLCRDLVGAFWDARHGALAALLGRMFTDGIYIDPVTVMSQITAQGMVSKVPGPFLHSVVSGPGEHDGVLWYADQVREMAARRSLREAAIRLSQQLEHGWSRGDDLSVRGAMVEFRGAMDGLEASMESPDALGGPQSMAEFLDGPTEEDWLVPGLLERSERIILTGSEGLGKSVLCRQIATSMAGSVHPFSGAVLGRGDRGIRVTAVDCENSAVQSRRGYGRVVRQVDRVRASAGLGPVDWKAQMSIDIRGEGMDLLNTRDVAHLEHIVAATVPDLLVLGPLYKIFDADPSDEKAVRHVAAVLDGLRARHRFALLIEAHPGKGEGADGARRMAPIGSSLWLRWPEYGFGIRRAPGARGQRAQTVDVVSWRGSREERSWPQRLKHAQALPWAPVSPAEAAVQDRVDQLEVDDPDGWLNR